MADAVQGLGPLAFSRPNSPPLLEVLPVKRFLSISNLFVLPLLALASASALSAQTLVVDKQNLVFNGQVGGPPFPQPINFPSINASAQPSPLSSPIYPWLKPNETLFGFAGPPPASITITADP